MKRIPHTFLRALSRLSRPIIPIFMAALLTAWTVPPNMLAAAAAPPNPTSCQLTVLQTLLNNDKALGVIDNVGIQTDLQAKVSQAASALSANNVAVARHVLRAFDSAVAAQTGKHISASAAPSLMAVGSGSSTPICAGNLMAYGIGGAGTLVLAHYSADPVGPPSYTHQGSYFDLRLAPGATFTEVHVVTCDLSPAEDAMVWWSGTFWIPVTSQDYYGAGTSRCVAASITTQTLPSASNLTGDVFSAVDVPVTTGSCSATNPFPADSIICNGTSPALVASAPAPTPIILSSALSMQGTAATVTVDAQDYYYAAPHFTFTCAPQALQVNWGDGVTTTATPEPADSTCTQTLSASHTYTTYNAVYSQTINVTGSYVDGSSTSSPASLSYTVTTGPACNTSPLSPGSSAQYGGVGGQQFDCDYLQTSQRDVLGTGLTLIRDLPDPTGNVLGIGPGVIEVAAGTANAAGATSVEGLVETPAIAPPATSGTSVTYDISSQVLMLSLSYGVSVVGGASQQVFAVDGVDGQSASPELVPNIEFGLPTVPGADVQAALSDVTSVADTVKNGVESLLSKGEDLKDVYACITANNCSQYVDSTANSDLKAILGCSCAWIHTFSSTETTTATTSQSVYAPGAAVGAEVTIGNVGAGASAAGVLAFVETTISEAPPQVQQVSPSSGPTSGGTELTITGSNFANAQRVWFGKPGADGSVGVAPAGFTVVSGSEIQLKAPAHGAGSVQVYVAGPGGLSTGCTALTLSCASAFTYANTSLPVFMPIFDDSALDLSPGYALGGPSYNIYRHPASFTETGHTSPMPWVNIQSDAWVSFTFTVPAGAANEIAYEIPAGGWLNNGPADILVNGQMQAEITQGIGPARSYTGTQLVLWEAILSPGTYTVEVLTPSGSSVNVYGFWFSLPINV